MVNNIKISLQYGLLVLFGFVPSLLILKGFSLCHIYTSSVCSGPSLLMTLDGSCELSEPLGQSARLSGGLFRVSAVLHLQNHANVLRLIFLFW